MAPKVGVPRGQLLNIERSGSVYGRNSSDLSGRKAPGRGPGATDPRHLQYSPYNMDSLPQGPESPERLVSGPPPTAEPTAALALPRLQGENTLEFQYQLLTHQLRDLGQVTVTLMPLFPH